MEIFTDMTNAVCDFGAYPQYLKNRRRRVFLYGLILAALSFLVFAVVPYVRFQMTTGGLVHLIDKAMPDFTLVDGKFDVDGEFSFDENGIYLYVNTDDYEIDGTAIRDTLDPYQEALVADADHMVLKGNGTIQTITFADLVGGTMTKEDLIDFLGPYLLVLTVVVAVLLYGWTVAGFFLNAVIVAIGGSCVARAVRLRLRFGEVYRLAVYATTAAVLLSLLIGLLPFYIPYSWTVRYLISLVYLGIALHRMSKLESGSEENRPEWS